MSTESIKKQAKQELVGLTGKQPEDFLPVGYLANDIPDLDWTIRVAEELGATLEIVIKFSGTVPPTE